MGDRIRIGAAAVLATLGVILTLASFIISAGGKELRYISILMALSGILLLFTRGNAQRKPRKSEEEETDENFFEGEGD